MDRKICTLCKDEKELDLFNKNKSRKDGYNNICRECSNISSKRYYKDNTEKHNKFVRERSKKSVTENRIKYVELLKNSCCVRCGFDNIVALEFDHKDEVNKINGIGKMVSAGYSWETILEEIKKCELVCANCHRIRTAKQQGWYIDLI